MDQKQAWQVEQEKDVPMNDDEVMRKAWQILQDRIDGTPTPVDYYIRTLGAKIQIEYCPEYAEDWYHSAAWVVDIYASFSAGVPVNNTNLPH